MAQIITPEMVSHARPRNFQSGADIYAAEIIKHQAENYHRQFGDDVLINPMLIIPKLLQPPKPYKLFVQYLHTFQKRNPLGDAQATVKWAKSDCVFVVAYRAMHEMLQSDGYKSVYVPMSIEPFTVSTPEQKHTDRVIWFGHTYSEKGQTYKQVRTELGKHGFAMDTISKGLFNESHRVSRDEAHAIVARYRYGVGVGRCAQEMFNLGLRVLIAGNGIGGLVMNTLDEATQLATNYNARIATFSPHLSDCIKYLPYSRIPKPIFSGEHDHARMVSEACS